MRLLYVEAQKIAFPYSKALVGGPYETYEEQWEAKTALTPKYPGCVVRTASVQVPKKEAARRLGLPKIEERTKQ